MQKYANLAELEKCCQTHTFLQNFVLIQLRTSPPKICKICKNLPILLILLTPHPPRSRRNLVSRGQQLLDAADAGPGSLALTAGGWPVLDVLARLEATWEDPPLPETVLVSWSTQEEGQISGAAKEPNELFILKMNNFHENC